MAYPFWLVPPALFNGYPVLSWGKICNRTRGCHPDRFRDRIRTWDMASDNRTSGYSTSLCERTDNCENITLSLIRMRAVTKYIETSQPQLSLLTKKYIYQEYFVFSVVSATCLRQVTALSCRSWVFFIHRVNSSHNSTSK